MNDKTDITTLLSLIERYYDCSLSDEEERHLRNLIARTGHRHPAIDEARAVMGFCRARRTARANHAPGWKVYGGIAAGVAVLVAAGLTALDTHRPDATALACIAYANGITITDEDAVLGIIADDMREFNDGMAADNRSLRDDFGDIAPIIDLYESESLPQI